MRIDYDPEEADYDWVDDELEAYELTVMGEYKTAYIAMTISLTLTKSTLMPERTYASLRRLP